MSLFKIAFWPGWRLSNMDLTLAMCERDLRRTEDSIRRQRNRLKQERHIPTGVARRLTALRLLGAPLPCIQAELHRSCQRLRRCRAPDVLSEEDVTSLVAARMLKEATYWSSNGCWNRRPAVAAQCAFHQYQLCQWVVEQNGRGWAPPSAVLIAEYRKFWGIGPHMSLVSEHLHSLYNRGGRKRFLSRWKKRWRMLFGRLRCKPGPSDELVRTKVTSGAPKKHGQWDTLAHYPRQHIESRHGGQKWVHKCVPPPGFSL